MNRVEVEITRLPHAPVQLPEYRTAGSAGMDIALAGEEVTVEPGARALLPTGFAVAIPIGYEGQIRMRSGFALRTGLILPNAPGTIDSDYRGELKVLVMNPGHSSVSISPGERFAQLIVTPVARAVWREVAELTESHRGSGGFGSTGRT